MKTTTPKPRTENIIVQELDGELLVYDLERGKAICLNPTAAAIWQTCDGAKDVDAICREAGLLLGQPVPSEMVWLALRDLKRENMLDFEDGQDSPLAGLSRREAVKRVGLASMLALPMIASLAAPAAAQSQSALGACRACTTGIGVGQGTCPSGCGGLTCFCYNNNSCMGPGAIATSLGCDSCRSLSDGMGNSIEVNNSFRCT